MLVETRGGYVKSFNRVESASTITAHHRYSRRGNYTTCCLLTTSNTCPPPPPVAAMKGKSHWAEGAHLSKGATLHSLPTNTGGTGRVLN